MIVALRRNTLLLAVGLSGLLWAAGVQAGLSDTIERIKPSIVVVGTFDKLRSPQFQMRGTGFAVGDGTLIATNSHVVPALPETEGREAIAALVRHGDTMQARVLRLLFRDNEHDLAVLRLNGPALPPLTLKSSDSVREGDSVALTGFPIGGVLGFTPVTHRGIVSSITPIAPPSGNASQLKDKSILRLRSGSFAIFQLDATAYPGNSGGPLYDADTGEVVGILNMVFVKATKEAVLEKPSGISYAIPARHLSTLLKQVTP